MRKDEARPGAEFSLRHFFDSIALGTGVGIRYDLSFLILRLDFGFALHVPYDTEKVDTIISLNSRTEWVFILPLVILSKNRANCLTRKINENTDS